MHHQLNNNRTEGTKECTSRKRGIVPSTSQVSARSDVCNTTQIPNTIYTELETTPGTHTSDVRKINYSG